MHRRIALALAATLIAAPLAALPTTVQADEPDTDPALSLRLPSRTVAFTYGSRGRAEVPLAVGLRTGADPLELWATRPSYDEGIRVVWKTPEGDVELPAGSMKNFSGLHRFLKFSVKDVATGKVTTSWKSICLNSYEAQRTRPDAPATSPYPSDCPYNAYTLGSVQGIERGWTSNVLGWQNPLRLARGKYDVSIEMAPRFVQAFGLDPADVKGTTRVIVKKGEDGEDEGRPSPSAPRPASKAPTGPTTSDADALEGPVPNLKSLPAWGIGISPNGNNLTFAATVWNAGNSPLVVDGFRVEGEDEMDAYQYFFDAEGNQTGYQPVGHFHWDAKPTHQHWHFKDFASYTLLREDMTRVARSKKEAFCLANTDFVDATVPDAAWRTDTDDLGTACGEENSQSIREVLAAGWGDTYAQFRAGQSFRLKGLPNGVYYIEVKGNPNGKLVESDTADNVALRKIILSGKPGARKVRVPQVGIIEENDHIYE
ncbi:MAG TPA: lysyl oxidase family protein [Nocardioides sp.]|nr:lysyl oxidase family protein [Nocardioides sp.]